MQRLHSRHWASAVLPDVRTGRDSHPRIVVAGMHELAEGFGSSRILAARGMNGRNSQLYGVRLLIVQRWTRIPDLYPQVDRSGLADAVRRMMEMRMTIQVAAAV